jgi:hypothetical protein
VGKDIKVGWGGQLNLTIIEELVAELQVAVEAPVIA